MTIDIRLVDYNDALQSQHLVQLLDEYARDPMGGGEGLPLYVKQNLVSNLRNIPTAFSLLAYAGDEPVGFSNCFEIFSTFACKPLVNIHDIGVVARSRGKGIAQLLLQAIDQIALERGCCKVTLEVLEGNTVAQAAYRRHGFEAYQLDPSLGCAQFWHKRIDGES